MEIRLVGAKKWKIRGHPPIHVRISYAFILRYLADPYLKFLVNKTKNFKN